MSDSGTTLAQLLHVDAQALRPAVARYAETHALGGTLSEAVLALVAEDVAAAAGEVLKLDIFELVLKAWAAVHELEAYADPVKHPPGERAVVRWGACTLKAPQVIDVKLGVGAVELPVLRLTIDLAAEFTSLALTIEGGAILKIAPGTARASAGLRYGETELIAPRKTPELQAERGIEFSPGLRIG